MLHTLHIENFRNVETLDCRFGPGFNYIYGDNGAGKTAILEAVALLLRGKSFRTNKLQSVIRHGGAGTMIRATVEQGSVTHRVGTERLRSGPVRFSVDGLQDAKGSDIARLLPIEVLLPDVAELVYGAPAGRRELLDWGLFHVEQRYLSVARQYRRTLRQRNAWLKAAGEQASLPRPEDDPWFPQYRQGCLDMTQMRSAYLEDYQPVFRETLAMLSPGLQVQITYDSGGLGTMQDVDKKIGETFERDVKFGVTHRGPHRGDLVFELGGQIAAESASRGQAKVIASAALLAQAVLQERQSGAKSLFLIDDFGAELDQEHWSRFQQALDTLGAQVIFTTTEHPRSRSSWLSANCELFHVEQGRLLETPSD